MGAMPTIDPSDYKCTQGINPNLPEDMKTLSLPAGPNGIKEMSLELTERVIAAFNGAYKIVTLMGTEALGLTFYQTRALHSANCAIQNGGIEFYNFVAAAFYVVDMLGQMDAALTKINEYYGYVTTCEYEANEISVFIEEWN